MGLSHFQWNSHHSLFSGSQKNYQSLCSGSKNNSDQSLCSMCSHVNDAFIFLREKAMHSNLENMEILYHIVIFGPFYHTINGSNKHIYISFLYLLYFTP